MRHHVRMFKGQNAAQIPGAHHIKLSRHRQEPIGRWSSVGNAPLQHKTSGDMSTLCSLARCHDHLTRRNCSRGVFDSSLNMDVPEAPERWEMDLN